MVGRRRQAHAAQKRRRQLHVGARSARGARARTGAFGRLARDQVAAAQRPNGAARQCPSRPVHHCGRRKRCGEMSRGSRLAARTSGLVLLAFAVACGEPRAPSPESRPTSPEVSMPDVSGAAPAVQSQLREAYTAMQQKASAASSAGERAAAYGDMGRLFLATEFLDSAERCFLNAQTLEPADPRWPYFLAHIRRRKNEPEKAAVLFERVLALEPN